ncbi:hypothetical protein LCGC14_3083300 [marine sediment metagenome]|uniref:Uncharacterized protein n=1 Tax=marine sediment metagenome TaxID=412755 RepID=A0A0F8YK92_9ZZZZ
MAIGTSIALGLGALAAGGVSAGLASRSGGQARRQAQQQFESQNLIQQQQLAMGRRAWTPAFDYWNAIMKGGHAANLALGPESQAIRGGFDVAQRSIEENLPRGGERNLSLAQLETEKYGRLGNLPTIARRQAAGSLAQLSGIPFGVGSAAGGQATGLAGNLLNYGLSQQQQALSGAQGIGELLYKIANKFGQKGGGGGGGGK